jgi:hypothetical protein
MDMDKLSPHARDALSHFGIEPWAQITVIILFLLTVIAVISSLAAMTILDLRRLDHGRLRMFGLVTVLLGSIGFIVLNFVYQDHLELTIIATQSKLANYPSDAYYQMMNSVVVVGFLADCAWLLAATLIILKLFSKSESRAS